MCGIPSVVRFWIISLHRHDWHACFLFFFLNAISRLATVTCLCPGEQHTRSPPHSPLCLLHLNFARSGETLSHLEWLVLIILAGQISIRLAFFCVFLSWLLSTVHTPPPPPPKPDPVRAGLALCCAPHVRKWPDPVCLNSLSRTPYPFQDAAFFYPHRQRRRRRRRHFGTCARLSEPSHLAVSGIRTRCCLVSYGLVLPTCVHLPSPAALKVAPTPESKDR